MNIGYISDLHTEFSTPSFNFEKSLDVLVIAGDVGQKSYLVKQVLVSILNKLSPHTQIIYVLGNHEYVYQVFDEVLNVYKNEFKDLNRVTILEKESVVINGVKFIGTTLWSGFDNKNEIVVNKTAHKIKDYGIKTINREIDDENYLIPFEANKMYDEFIKCKDFLYDELKKDYDGKIVVITHFPPHNTCKNPKFENDISSNYYCNHLPEFFDLDKVDLWIYGHNHYNSDSYVKKTRLVSNSRGRVKKDFVENEMFKTNNFISM